MAKTRRGKKSSLWRGLLKFLVWMAALGAVVVAAYMVFLDIKLRERLDSRKYELPARVFARPLELANGRVMHPDALEAEFDALGYKRVDLADDPGEWSREGMTYRVYRRAFVHSDGKAPAAMATFTLRNDEIRNLKSGADNPREFRLDAAFIGSLLGGGDDRSPVRLSELSDSLLGPTLIAVEDRYFVHHFGVSPRGIARAFRANLEAGEVVQGGSTITQQLVKNIFFDHKPSLWRKINEALMAVLLEFHYDKGYILQEYMNEMWLGQQGSRAIYGFGLASQFYFQQPVTALEPHQIALLVGLAKGASYYNPWRHPRRALERRNVVLGIMQEQGLITDVQLKKYRATPLGVVAAAGVGQNPYPAFSERVVQELEPYYSYEELRTAGLRVYTTLAPSVQRIAERTLEQQLEKIEKDRQLQEKALQGAIVLVDNATGEVLTMVGDRRPRYPGFNRALEARRQVGSLIKPAVFLAALEQPRFYNLMTLLQDTELEEQMPNGDIWSPANFDKRSHGMVPLYLVLAKSYNQATARLGIELGVESVVNTLRRLGISADLPRVPALFLGAAELTPFEVAGMYQTMANGGEHVQLRTVLAVTGPDGDDLQSFRRRAKRSIDDVPAYLIRYGLEQVMREGTGRNAYRRLPNSIAFAGKSGTTNNGRDSWFSGFSPDTTAVVWIGRDDNTGTGLTGSTGALPVWTEIMRQLPHRHGRVVPPRGVEVSRVSDKGERMGRCSGGREMPFSIETELRSAPGCEQGRDNLRGWFRGWFDRDSQQQQREQQRKDSERMTPGWGIDPQRERQQREQEERRDDEEEPLSLPQGWRR